MRFAFLAGHRETEGELRSPALSPCGWLMNAMTRRSRFTQPVWNTGKGFGMEVITIVCKFARDGWSNAKRLIFVAVFAAATARTRQALTGPFNGDTRPARAVILSDPHLASSNLGAWARRQWAAQMVNKSGRLPARRWVTRWTRLN